MSMLTWDYPFIYSLLHFCAQVVVSGAGAGILYASLDNDNLRFWVLVPYCYAASIVAVAGIVRLAVWAWQYLSVEARNIIREFFFL